MPPFQISPKARGKSSHSLVPGSPTEVTCPLTLIRTRGLSSGERTVPFDILFSWELRVLHRSPRATHLPLMLLDLGGTSRKCLCLLIPSLPVTALQPLPPPLSNTFPLHRAQGQALPIRHHFFWFIKTSARALVAVAVIYIFFISAFTLHP